MPYFPMAIFLWLPSYFFWWWSKLNGYWRDWHLFLLPIWCLKAYRCRWILVAIFLLLPSYFFWWWSKLNEYWRDCTLFLLSIYVLKLMGANGFYLLYSYGCLHIFLTNDSNLINGYWREWLHRLLRTLFLVPIWYLKLDGCRWILLAIFLWLLSYFLW